LITSNNTVIIVLLDNATISEVIVPRGGKRVGAGSKPKWKHGKTKTIRVPEAIAQEILKIAHELDENGIIEVDTQSKVVNLSGISIPEVRGKKAVLLEDLLRIGYEIKPVKLANLVKNQQITL
jgi:hypothetical protein